ncbi:MAG TPA: hypothetical protein PKD55_01470 [Bellilinea sp.]|nr:hypothetical protein [Bellilinea sp.]
MIDTAFLFWLGLAMMGVGFLLILIGSRIENWASILIGGLIGTLGSIIALAIYFSVGVP